MSSPAIVLDAYFVAQVEDVEKWEERFDLLVEELCSEYGPYFFWSDDSATKLDVIFLMYPPGQHSRIVEEKALGDYVKKNRDRLSFVHVIVVGRNPKGEKVSNSDVVDIVNAQCLPNGVKANPGRVVRPEDLDDEVRATLVRLHTRRQRGASRIPGDSEYSITAGPAKAAIAPGSIYKSGDL